MKYNLFYNDGGHSGPHENLETAWKYAKEYLSGSNSTTCVEIRPENSTALGGFHYSWENSYYCWVGSPNCLNAGQINS